MPIEFGPIPPVRPVRTGPFSAQSGAQGAGEPKRAPAATPETPAVVNEAAAIPAKPPVDAERVAQIRNAIADGSYPLLPAKIADAMIAAGLQLSLGE